MQHDAGEQLVTGVIAQPGEVTCIVAGGRRGGFDLERHQMLGIQFGDHVYLVAAVVLSKVIQTTAVLADCCLCPQLGHHHGLEEAPQKVAVSHCRLVGGAGHGCQKRRIDQEPFGRQRQPLEPVRRPGGQFVDDVQSSQQIQIAQHSATVDAGRFAKGCVVGSTDI